MRGGSVIGLRDYAVDEDAPGHARGFVRHAVTFLQERDESGSSALHTDPAQTPA